MSTETASLGPAARRGVWVAGALAVLSLVSAFFNPAAGLAAAILLAAAAAGIRRKRAWAAIAVFCLLTIPVLAGIARIRQIELLLPFAFSAAMMLILSVFPFAAARELWRDPNASRSPLPWLGIVCLYAVFAAAFHPYVMPSESMSNTLLTGDQLLAETASWRLGREPQRDHMVVYRYPVDPRQTFVKRIAGVPGDRIKIVDKQLFRNGLPVEEPWAIHSSSDIDSFRDNFPSGPNTSLPALGEEMLRQHVQNGEVVVPAGKYFVLGDNRDNSLDSRYTGFISRADIMGAPVLIYASYDREGKGQGSVLNLRWNRLLKVL